MWANELSAEQIRYLFLQLEDTDADNWVAYRIEDRKMILLVGRQRYRPNVWTLEVSLDEKYLEMITDRNEELLRVWGFDLLSEEDIQRLTLKLRSRL